MSFYGVTVSNTRQYYGRAWKITIVPRDQTTGIVVSSSGLDDQESGSAALRCVFHVEKVMLGIAFFADVEIWNLNAVSTDQVIKEGHRLIIEAGYQNGPYGKIFDGTVFQPMFERVGVTDYVTTLHCMDGLGILTQNISNVTLDSGYDHAAVVASLARSARKEFQLGNITSNLDSKKSPRGKVIFGPPSKYFRQIAQDNNAEWYVENDTILNMAKIDDEYQKEALVIEPGKGLIGSPQQTECGVNFRHLLNPDICLHSPPMVVKMDMKTVRQLKASPGRRAQILSPLDEDGQYKIIGVRYTGDTRGNDWYVDATGVNLAYPATPFLGKYSR